LSGGTSWDKPPHRLQRLASYRPGGRTTLVYRRSGRRTQGGRLIHSIYSTRLSYVISAAPSGALPGCWRQRSQPLADAQGHRAWPAQEPAAGPVPRYQWARLSYMIHVDTKQLARFEQMGHRITGDRRLGSSRGAGY